MPQIHFPVFVRLEVDGYELFPGPAGQGFSHSFEPGVTVIAGVNGVGKTTMLNIMLRLLLGPFNPEKVTPYELGIKSHTLVSWAQRGYFKDRVTDGALEATALAQVQIGTHLISVRRRLADLSIVWLEADRQELEPTEEEFGRVVVDACNVSSRFDYDFLVRYLVFFLEQRVPLFWNERGQIETFRILLCESALAERFQLTQDRLQEADSAYRTLRWPANRRKKELERQRVATASGSAVGARVKALQEQFRALTETDEGLLAAISDVSSESSSLKTKLLLIKIELEQARRDYEVQQEKELARLFPSNDESTHHIFMSLISGHGCGVCGSRGRHGMQRLQAKLARGDCPVCDSEKAQQERRAKPGSGDAAGLRAAFARVSKLASSVESLSAAEAAAQLRLRELLNSRSQTQIAISQARDELVRLNAKLPPQPESIRQLEAQIAVDDEQLEKLGAELASLSAEYETLIVQVDERVQTVADRVCEYFSHYARSFLAEQCRLSLSRKEQKVGQDRRFDLPCFSVYMTSATSPDRLTERKSEEDVSESQKEFIDLAFRMALIAAVGGQSHRAMLVIETPEASLDAYFVDQAGALLRQFAAEGNSKGNLVIVSSNLNRQNMVPALLGFTERRSSWPGKTEVKRRVINMLDVCLQNAAVGQQRRLYEKELFSATQGRLGSATT